MRIIMEFPDDIWRNVFSYFHSPYKCPPHYKAIMENNNFYFLRNHIKIMNKQRDNCLIRNSYLRNSYYVNMQSGFYIQMICIANVNTNTTVTKNKNNYTFKNRGVARLAKKAVLDDFIGIIDEYKKTQYQIYANLNY